ncbi:MAG: SIS domain-containing protein [Chloroflexi bacterium]|nr:SIS domain-containing protein [Chloroflexota bacterium]
MNDLMLREMQSQPADLAAALVDLRTQVTGLDLGRPQKVVLTGSGDSGFAAMAVEYAFTQALGRPVWALPSASAARYGQGRIDGLTVVISVSGEVRRTIEAAMAARNAGGRVVALTAGAASSLAKLADAVLLMPEPISRSTPHTRDYTMTLLALLALLERLSGTPIPELDAWPEQIGDLLPASLAWADRLAEAFASVDEPVWFLGMGPERGTAAYGALKFWEAGGSAAWWDDLEEFGHGSQLAARPGQLAVLFASGPAWGRAHEMRDGLERMGLSPAVVGDRAPEDSQCLALPEIRAELSPLLTSIPTQALAHAFATRRGIEVELPMGGNSLGDLYDEVHRDWMRRSALEPIPRE